MMRSKELRTKAWDSLKGKYWLAFAATLISGILVSLGGLFSGPATSIMEVNMAALEGGAPLDDLATVGFLALSGTALFLSFISMLLTIFVQGPALIGSCKYFIVNADAKPSLAEVFSGFKTRYGRNFLAVLLINIKIFLWSLLFLIPGLIKSFEYSIIPYILADNPEISISDAFKQAKEMMRGNKWRLFKLNFSFIGWFLLASLTLGIGAFFLIPYVDAANAEFYIELKNK